MDDLNLTRRLLSLGAIYALLATVFLLVAEGNLAHLHTSLDASACILAAIAASQILRISRREGSRLGLFVGMTLCAAAVAEAVHLLVGVTWTDSLLEYAAQSLRPSTWPPTAFVPALGFIAAWGMSRRAHPIAAGWFAAILLFFLVVSLALSFLVLPYSASGWLGISCPSLIGVPLCWAVIGWVFWRARREDRLIRMLDAGALYGAFLHHEGRAGDGVGVSDGVWNRAAAQSADRDCQRGGTRDDDASALSARGKDGRGIGGRGGKSAGRAEATDFADR